MRFRWISDAIREMEKDHKSLDRPANERETGNDTLSDESRFCPGHVERLVALARKYQKHITEHPVDYKDVLKAIRYRNRTVEEIKRYIETEGIGKGRFAQDISVLGKVIDDMLDLHLAKFYNDHLTLTAEGRILLKLGIVESKPLTFT